MIDFGQWVKSQRNNNSLPIRTLSALAGVDVGTISRIENNKTQATVATAVRICKGLEIPLGTIISELGFEKSLHYYLNNNSEGEIPRITSCQINLFLKACLRRPNSIDQFFIESFDDWNHLYDLPENFSLDNLTSEDKIHKLIWSPTFEFPFPSTLSLSQIQSLIRSKELFINADAGAYLHTLRDDRRFTLVDLEKKIGMSDSYLYRLEAGLLENIKLPDLVSISNFLDPEGFFFLVSWLAGEFSALIEREQEFKEVPPGIPQAGPVYRVAINLIKLSRWIRFWGQDYYPAFIASFEKVLAEDK